jgi:4-diphosphocytidyl-2-C-methyl-D-erythritol kinase
VSGADPVRRLAPVVRLAPAKLNLTLAVIARRADGYHDLHSVMVPLALADRLSVAVAPAGEQSLFVRGEAGPLAGNLVLRALAETAAALGGPVAPPALAARLEKVIPVAAGLAGGSSDAAAAIDAALEAWSADLGQERRAALAARLGSDVPFFLAGGPAAVEGRGETVTPLPPLRGPSPGILLVTPAIPISTADVFRAFEAGARRAGASSLAASRHLADEWRAGLDARRLRDRAAVLAPANDLTPASAAVAPELVPARRALARLLGRPIGQSGSGPTFWVLYPSQADAAAAADAVSEAIDQGELRLPGPGRPFIHATTIASAGEPAAERGAQP